MAVFIRPGAPDRRARGSRPIPDITRMNDALARQLQMHGVTAGGSMIDPNVAFGSGVTCRFAG